ncbi:MAG TPA: hypothetical protein VGM80_03585, partial [Gaiellaceae bacterium]
MAGAPSRSLRIAGRSYPVILPSPKDPRLHVSATILTLYVLGETEFHFRLSIPQIATAILTCALIELVVTFRQKKMIVWPASAMLTGSGIAFIMRTIGTRHGDWWSLHEDWVYAAAGAVAMASKYLIHFRGRHVFIPSNFALVLAFVALGSGRVEPLQFWWGPVSPALVVVLLVIVVGALVVLTRVGLLAVAVIFWLTFAGALGVLALSGHAFTANWHLGPVADGYFWKVLVLSPEVFIFLAFMITDPKTAPETRHGRSIYALAIGLLGALLIAPMQTEYWAKVALLGALTLVCAARPVVLLAREALERRAAGANSSRPPLRGALAVVGAASFAALIVAAGSPARSFAKLSGSAAAGVPVTIEHTASVVSISPATGRQVAGAAIRNLQQVSAALSARDPAGANEAASGPYLTALKARIAKGAGAAIVVPDYRVATVDLRLLQAVDQAPPTIVATLTGEVTFRTYAAGSTKPRNGSTAPFKHAFDLALTHGRFLIVGEGGAPIRPVAPVAQPSYEDMPKGTGAFRQIRLVNVAP